MSASSRGIRCARVVATAAIALSLIPPAPSQGRPTYPSQEEVESARATADRRADEAEQLQSRLSVILSELSRLEMVADAAVEDFNEARAALAQAAEAAAEADRRARAADAEAEQAHRFLGQIAASSYRNGGVLATVGLVLEAEGPAQVFDQLGALQTAANSQSHVYERWRAARVKAEAAQADADRALKAQEQASEDAQQARDTASAAVAQQLQLAAAADAEREKITVALAAANETTVELERQRQDGLRAEAERRAQEAAEAKAREAAAREAAAREAAAREAAERQAREQAAATSDKPAASDSPTTSSRDPDPEPTATQQTSGSVPYDAAAAKKVVAFARAQLGEPYVWGAAGPDAWDCSGLTMMAWRQAGVRLTHGARAQFRETRQLSYGQLRPGDLVFHANGSTPSTIFHVGIYIGDGKMIHAPNSSRPVEIKSIFYMGAPGFYSRPMT